jgi:hypothetical protein
MKNILILITLLVISSLAYAQSDIRSQIDRNLRHERIEKEIAERKTEFIERKTTNQTRKSQTQGTRRTVDPYMKATKGVHHSWATNAWQYEYNTEYTYDSDKRVILETMIDSSTGDFIFKREIIYTSAGNIASNTIFYHDGSDWIPMEKDSTSYHSTRPDFLTGNYYYSYDEISTSWELNFGYKTEFSIVNNNIVESVNLYWDGLNWEEEDKTIYDYDVNNKLISETYHEMSEPEYNTLYNYSSGVMSEMIFQYWDIDSMDWINEERYYDIKFGNFTGDLVDYVIFNKDLVKDAKLEEFYNDSWIGEWINSEKGVIVHSANGYVFTTSEYTGFIYEDVFRETFTMNNQQTVSLNEYYDNGAWVNSFRMTTFLDHEAQERGIKYESWDDMGNSWDVNWWVETIYEFDANGKITQKTLKMLDFMSSALVNVEREVYTDWKDFNPLGTNPIQILKNVTCYPNPTSDKLTIQFQNPTGLKNQITVLDITGKIVYSTSGTEDNIIIPLGNLNAGIYIVKISSGQEHAVARIVKQ